MPILDRVLTHTVDGRMRRVGVEIEFAGLAVADVAQLVQDHFGGESVRRTDYEVVVEDTRFGDLRVELDVALLKKMGRDRAEGEESGFGRMSEWTEELLARIAPHFAPCELVTAPLPMERVTELDPLIECLHAAGARGTDDSWIYAFGVHFNPEAPALEAGSILAYLRAFVLLEDWLRESLAVDLSRRLTPFIDPFPKAYRELILSPEYRPDLDRLGDDYLEHNPTRNRALDLLPLLAHIDEDRVRAAVSDPLVKLRPTYHYRLSNCRVGDPAWRLTGEWRHWLVVERLAQRPDLLRGLSEERREHSLDLGGWLTQNQLLGTEGPP